MTDRPIVFLDTETNGLHHDRRPWEIAWIRREPDGTEVENVIHITDVDNTNAELQGLQVGRFHERWRGYSAAYRWSHFSAASSPAKGEPVAVSESNAADIIERETRGAIIVGAVPSFDTEVLAAMLRRHQRCPAWHYALVDVENMAAGWLSARPAGAPIIARLQHARRDLTHQTILTNKVRSWTNTSPTLAEAEAKETELRTIVNNIEDELGALLTADCRSDDLSRACGVEPPTPEERHTALGDARWVKRWYDHIRWGA